MDPSVSNPPVDLSLFQSTDTSKDARDTASTTAGLNISLPATVKDEPCVADSVEEKRKDEGREDVISRDDDRGLGKECESAMEVIEGAGLEEVKLEEEEEEEGGKGESEEGEIAADVKESTSSQVTLPSKLQRFYFESDILALKNNPDYQKLLKTLAILEAQKMQAIRDLETLVQAQAKAEKNPIGFVEALKNRTLEPLPRRQRVVELPEIEWKGYIESLQKVAKQHTSLHKTRRHNAANNKPLIFELDEKPSTSTKPKDPNKPASYRQPWTPEEQAKFEELLKIYPPEVVERKRYQKIAKAMGTRTTQQVASHVQKYFIKLASAGLPVPGRMPNMARYSKCKKGKGKRGFRRPSTFFTTLMPNVFMTEEDYSTPGTSKSGSPSVEGSLYEGSSDEDSESSENLGDMLEGDSGSSTPHLIIKCCSCGIEVKQGVYWQCTECPVDSTVNLCIACVNSDYQSQLHSPSHDLQPLTVTATTPAESATTTAGMAGRLGGGVSSSSAAALLVDKDYASFETQMTQTSYNYLDPNFFPAS